MTRVLVVDDDFMVARIHRGFVERVDGFEVVGTARTGDEALALVGSPAARPRAARPLPARRVRARRRGAAAGRGRDVRRPRHHRGQGGRRRARRGAAGRRRLPAQTVRLRRPRAAAAGRMPPSGPATSATTSRRPEIDAAFTSQPVGAAAAGAAAEGPQRRRRPRLVEPALRESSETLSATECAEVVGISRVSARRYLEHFVSFGQAEVTLRYGTTGRPERRYRWL